MENVSDIGIGAGLAALAFWLFVAAIIIGAIWDNIRKREAQHETVRRIVESGQKIDQAMFDKLLNFGDSGKEGRRRLDQDFKLTGYILVPIALGMALLGLFIGMQYSGYLGPLLGVAALLACLSMGFIIIGKTIAGKDFEAGQPPSSTRD